MGRSDGLALLFVIFLGLILNPCQQAHAQVDTDLSGGAMQVGWSSTACGAGIAGALRYNSSSGGSIQFCNGTSWSNIVLAPGSAVINDLSDAITNYSSGNLFMGDGAGASITTGSYNTALGHLAMNALTTGNYNTAAGYEAMRYMRGNRNTAAGTRAIRGSTTPADNTGSDNTAVGYEALMSVTSGSRNTVAGSMAARLLTTGNDNTVAGYAALGIETTGSFNTVAGSYAMANKRGSANTVAGFRALYGNGGTSNNNVAIGHRAMELTDTGANNVAVGYYALRNNTTGNNNIAVGYRAGDNLTSGNNNIIIGHDIDFPSSTGSNQLNIGNVIYGVINNGYVGINVPVPVRALDVNGNIHYTGVITDVSDRRLKTDIMPLEVVSGSLMRVKTYRYRKNGASYEYGVVAQELRDVFPILVAGDGGDMMSVNYIGLIAPMIKTLQEQDIQIREQQEKIEFLREAIRKRRGL